MHLQGSAWQRPSWFTRYTIDYQVGLGPNALWGFWQDGLGLGREEREILTRLDAEIHRRLTAYGRAQSGSGWRTTICARRTCWSTATTFT